MITLSADAVTLILTLLIPVATGLVTKSTAPNRVKAIAAIVFAAIVTLIGQTRTDTGTAIISAQMAGQWAITIAVQLAAYLGIYKPIAPKTVTLAATKGIG
jgi:small basic protein